ncbi:hypothetical protein FHR84_002413 [Actinopolyspora biskrensis]|uniref:Uncharacterized protein n=1 Tax=Actinopolyspora biskrensis TaxID=1470178 RepID=A0A852YZW3_9ACTN|nr:hypothetical protein [Actinopolyspora biskrensis]NYH79079.1 hypothetical protein [Actinopolyspora biskrensis]
MPVGSDEQDLSTAEERVEPELPDPGPKVFALLERHGEHGTELFAWGVEIGAHASVFRPDGGILAHCESGLDAWEMFSIIRDVVLVWPRHQDRPPEMSAER